MQLSRGSMKFEKSKFRRQWFLFQARSVHSLIYPSMLICLIFGVHAYKMDTFHESNYVFSKARSAYSTVVIIVYIIFLLAVFYHLDVSGKVEYNSIPGMLQGNFYLILGGFITIVTYALSRQRIKVFQNLTDIAARLPAEKFNKMAKWIHLKDIVVFLFLASHIFNIFSSNLYITLTKSVLLYTTIVVYMMDMLYMNCICVLMACFERINERLRHLKQVLISDEPHLLRRVYHEQKNPLLLMELRALKKQHLLISDVVQIVNTTFGLQLIVTVVLTFEEVTFSLYFYILQSFGQTGIDLEKQIWYSYFITSVALFSVKLVLVIWACETGKDQALQIGNNIHEVLVNTTNKEIKDELEIFSLQVLHRDNIFTAKGLTMDAGLLTKIAGSITTYLLVLIQFLLSNAPCEVS